MPRGNWHHAPCHTVTHPGIHIVTAATYQQVPLFRGADLLQYLEDQLLGTFTEYGWDIQAWAVFPNHYHIIAFSPEASGSQESVTRKLHSRTAIHVNQAQNRPGRQVWFNRWDTHLTFPKSYLARLNYVHRNAVHHALVQDPTDYPYCSARWFAEHANPAFYREVSMFKTDRVSVQEPEVVIW